MKEKGGKISDDGSGTRRSAPNFVSSFSFSFPCESDWMVGGGWLECMRERFRALALKLAIV